MTLERESYNHHLSGQDSTFIILIVCLNNLSDPDDVVVPLPDTQCLTSFCVNIKVLSSGYKLTVLSGL